MFAFVTSKYAQAKRETDTVARWLACAAQNYGLAFAHLRPADASSNPEQPPEKTRQQKKNAKKNQRKKAKAAAAKASSAAADLQQGEAACEPAKVSAPPPPPTSTAQHRSGSYMLSAAQFVEAAKHLHDRQACVPVEVIQLMRRCIDSRKSAFMMFKWLPTFNRRSHLHFISVIEEALALLEDLVPKHKDSGAAATATADAATDGRDSSFSADKNRFGLLDIEEVEDLPDIDLPPPPRPAAAGRATQPSAVYSLEEDEDEVLFYVIAFYRDLHNLREYLMQTWADYRRGKISLVTASIVTNTALEAIRKTHDEFSARYVPRFGSVEALTGVCIELVKAHLGIPHSGPLLNPDLIDDEDDATVAMYDFFFLPVLQFVEGFQRVLVDGKAPVCKKGYFGVYRADADRSTMTYRERYDADKVLMAEALGEFTLLGYIETEGLRSLESQSCSPGAAAHGQARGAKDRQTMASFDEMAKELSELRDSRKLTIMTLLCVQVFLDINHVLQGDVERGLAEYDRTLDRMSLSLQRRKKVEPTTPPVNWPPQNERALATVAEMTTKEARPHEHFHQYRVRQLFELGLRRSEMPEDHVFFKRNPLFCGMMLFRSLLVYQEMGLALVDCWGTVLYTAHLYVAHRHSGGLPGSPNCPIQGLFEDLPGLRWPDIETVMAMHGPEAMFAGKVPTNPDESFKSFSLMVGYSGEAVSRLTADVTQSELLRRTRDLRRRPLLDAKRGPKGLADPSVVVRMFRDRYSPFVRTDVKNLGEMAAATGASRASGLAIDVETIQELLSAIKEKDATGEALSAIQKRRRHRVRTKYSLLQLLDVLRAGLEVEGRSLCFDYVEMHVRCIMVLRRVVKAVEEQLTKKVGPNFLDDEGQLPWIVGWVLQFACKSGQAGRAMGMVKGQEPVFSRMLCSASRALVEQVSEWEMEKAVTKGKGKGRPETADIFFL
ncbi:uncharacterized protein PFL1_04565 [Pseudozyma flocculosa PF-1]|uniref:DUF6604 domain-containing protein n=2 Tax=Pseudozyma flocculosa TaxID=84751 RepID=A0A5C3F9F8_9BASI|nr:uncharacterized protein PFL1_04565 [Pseudozyma flocculosa PF-1]EPQ27820.1 hypothetical protein PFL1_04565 [Pseudozyma flocculosa PF-1]SPO41052.1 uncharacterized protein PSFLO_06534 [Pseudozyma flocculosa]